MDHLDRLDSHLEVLQDERLRAMMEGTLKGQVEIEEGLGKMTLVDRIKALRYLTRNQQRK